MKHQDPAENVLAISSPIIVNGEAVIFLTVYGHALRLAWPDKDTASAANAYAAISEAFGQIVGARATWIEGPSN